MDMIRIYIYACSVIRVPNLHHGRVKLADLERQEGKTKRIARSTYLLKNVASMKAERVVKSYLGHFQPLSSSYVLVPTLFAFLSTQHAILSFLIASPRVELTA